MRHQDRELVHVGEERAKAKSKGRIEREKDEIEDRLDVPDFEETRRIDEESEETGRVTFGV